MKKEVHLFGIYNYVAIAIGFLHVTSYVLLQLMNKTYIVRFDAYFGLLCRQVYVCVCVCVCVC